MKMRWLVPTLAFVVGAVLAVVFFRATAPTVAADAPGEKGAIYAQLSSAVTQLPKDGTPLLVTMESNDALAGLIHSDKEKPEEIKVKTPGAYFLVAAIQVAKTSGEADDYVDVWIKQNGEDVANSNCRQAIKDGKFTSVLVCQGVAECKAGDTINVAVSASTPNKGLGIVAITPKGEPVIPSIIFSMYKIN